MSDKVEKSDLKLGFEISKFQKVEKASSDVPVYKWNSENGNPFADNLPMPKAQAAAYENYLKDYTVAAYKEVAQMGIDDLKKTGSSSAVYSVPRSLNLSQGNMEVYVNLDGEIVTGGFGKERKVEKGLDIRVKLKQTVKSALSSARREIIEKNERKK